MLFCRFSYRPASRFRSFALARLFGRLAVAALLLVAATPAGAVEPAEQAGGEVSNPPQGIADLKALETRIQQTVARVTPSVVSVAGGSGVVITRDGYVLTVAHVAERAGRQVVVIFPDGRRARAVTLGNDHGADAGLVKIGDPGPWPHAEMGNSADLKPGHWSLTLGYPITFDHGKPPILRIGRVLFNRKTEIVTDGTIMGGDSGAPLFNLDGRVIGIGTKCDNSLTFNLHVPIDCFRDEWEQLAKGEDFNSLTPRRTMLGVVGAESADDARIGHVIPGSGAEKAGLRADDVLLRFGGQEVRTYDELPPLVQRRKPGERVEVELRRGSETLKLQVTLGQSESGENR
jgi:serine protease Do